MTAPAVTPTGHVAPPPAAEILFRGLLDDAAIFPPGDTPMAAALRGYAASLRSADAPYVGSFLCSSPRLGELLTVLAEELADDLPQLDLSLVVPGGVRALDAALEPVAQSRRLVLRAVELPAGDAGVASTGNALKATLPAGVLGYVEVPLGRRIPAAVEAVAAGGHRVKFRTGGTSAGAFPAALDLAGGLAACLQADVPFKLTAGLHHAVRHRDPATGFENHGFLNVLAALTGADDVVDAAGLADVLEQRDGAALARCAASLDEPWAARVRSRFVAFGTCSTADPLADLRALGLVPAAPGAAA